MGYETYKLKFGHRGGNHAVRTESHKIITTAQNHGFAVSIIPGSSLPRATNISDDTNEGLFLPELFAFSVQFHPEGSPGPHDGFFYFEKFVDKMTMWRQRVEEAPHEQPSQMPTESR